MKQLEPNDFIMMPIPASQYSAVCALLGGAAVAALSTGSGTAQRTGSGNVGNATGTDAVPSDAAEQSAGGAEASPVAATDAGANAVAGDESGEVDAHGHPWSPDLHASTKGKTKDGLWRMKVGVSRPDPLPGFPKSDATGSDTGTSVPTDGNSATSPTATEAASAPADTSTGAEDDEFAAFRAANEASSAADAAAAASVPARNWTDADLGALCNQAAVKLGDPSPIKEIIAQYVPSGEVAHSRNIPADKREDFAKAVETKAGIEFAG